jgi:hypothetical protein
MIDVEPRSNLTLTKTEGHARSHPKASPKLTTPICKLCPRRWTVKGPEKIIKMIALTTISNLNVEPELASRVSRTRSTSVGSSNTDI